MTHGQPDHDPAPMAPVTAPAIPTPTIGAGSSDLRTASDNPAELRRLLQLAQERLAFYESFDRIVGENVRRSGELMLERIGLREQAAAQAAEAARVDESQRRYRDLLQDLMREAATLRTTLDEIETRLRVAEATFGADVPASPDAPDGPETGNESVAARSAPEGDADPEPATPQAVEAAGEAARGAPPLPARTASNVAMEAGGAAIPTTAPTPEQMPEPEPAGETWEAPRVIELIAHRVPRAADALSLQRYLGGLDQVAGVVAREFAEGVLRLQVTSQTPISADDIHGWPEHPGVRVLQHQSTVIEIECGPGTA